MCEDWMEQLVYFFFKACQDHQVYLDTLMNHGLFHLHRLAMLDTCFLHKNIVTQHLYLEVPHYMRRFLVRAYVDTALSFFEEWKRTDFALSLEEITEMYLDIVHHPDPQD